MEKELSLFYLSRQNLKHKLFRSSIVAAAVTIVAAVLFPLTILGESISRSLAQGTSRLGADMMVVPPGYTAKLASALIAGEPSTFLMDGSVAGQVAGIEGVDRISPQLYFASLASG